MKGTRKSYSLVTDPGVSVASETGPSVVPLMLNSLLIKPIRKAVRTGITQRTRIPGS